MAKQIEILAKSVNYGNLSLLEHTEHVVKAVEIFARGYEYDFDVSIAKKGAILHDLGKAHPHFQRKIQHLNESTLDENRKWSYIHRHEISSMAFLPCFPEHEWPALIDLVIAHHKSIENDPRGRGIIDLAETDRHFVRNHLRDWDQWYVYGIEIIDRFGFSTKSISSEEAQSAINFVLTYCEDKKYGWSPWRGLLRSADHFASAFSHDTPLQLKRLFHVPDLGYYCDPMRKVEYFPLSYISAEDVRKHTMVVAPTGAGKTDYLLRRCRGRVFYTLPYQASINAMWERIRKTLPDQDVRLLHASSRIIAGDRIDEVILQPLAGSAVKILTPHQMAAIILGTAGFESMMLDLQGSDVILDEIHTYHDISRTMVLEIVRMLLHLDCRIHVGTATMPTVLYNEIKAVLGGDRAVLEVKLNEATLDTFDRHQVYKMEDELEIVEILENAFKSNEKVLAVYNTVPNAQRAFMLFEECFPNVPKMLIHSRFRRGDRAKLERELMDEYNTRSDACLVVSTQVVEVSLDISFDRMITQAAPLDSLIQRFGRVNRLRNMSTIGKYKPVHVIKPSGRVKPYELDTVRRSFDVLPDNGELLKERSLQELIDDVYPGVLNTNRKKIDVHLVFQNGCFTIKELTDCAKSTLVETLEIDSATCILQSDREKYLTAKWAERLHLEIPVNYNLIARHKSNYEQLEVGSYPFVIPQADDDYHKLGLKITEHDPVI